MICDGLRSGQSGEVGERFASDRGRRLHLRKPFHAIGYTRKVHEARHERFCHLRRGKSDEKQSRKAAEKDTGEQ